jgi:hypothetical protein
MNCFILKVIRLTVVWFFACQLFTLQAFAQWSTNPSVNNTISIDTNRQNACRIVSDGSGGAIITWWDCIIATNDHNIYAQRINSAGIVQWTANGVPICTNPAHQQNPEMASDGNGGAIITWFDSRNNAKNEIFAQKINADGVVQWTADGVSVGTVAEHYQQGSPTVISDSSGGAIIAWEDWRGDLYNATRGIYAQNINAEGEIQWGVGGISLNGTGGGESPKIVSDGDGGAIIAWHQWVGVYPEGGLDIYVQKVNVNGSISWASDGVVLCSLPSEQRFAQIVSDGNGGAIIAWEDARNGSYSNLYAQKVNSDGFIQWTADGVPLSPFALTQINHKLLSDGNGGAFVTWQYSNNVVCTQRIDSDGVYQWRDDGITVNNFRDARYPQIATDGKTGVIITWYNGEGNIFAQRVDSAGTVLWDANGVSVCYDPSPQYEPQITADGIGGAIIAWDDYRNTDTNSTDIYAQRISGNGTLGLETGVSEKKISPPSGFTLNQNYPNPFITETRISFTVVMPGLVSLKVFNAEGKEVSMLVNEFLEPGNYPVIFNAAGLPGGVYYYTLVVGDENETRPMILLK